MMAPQEWISMMKTTTVHMHHPHLTDLTMTPTAVIVTAMTVQTITTAMEQTQECRMQEWPTTTTAKTKMQEWTMLMPTKTTMLMLTKIMATLTMLHRKWMLNTGNEQRTHGRFMRARKPRDYAHPFGPDHVLMNVTLTQYSVQQGLKMFGEAGAEAVLAEMKQLHDREVMKPVDMLKLSTP
jgi:hypothetical protein